VRAPLSWLRAYCDPALSADEIAARLNMSGTEVERVDRVGVGDASRFVVGKVVDARQHPDADRLRVCTVDDGSGGEARTIVCGAPNVESGQTVAVALPGALMPDGTALGEAKLRGVVSSGMILAEDEVGVGEDHGGIMVLPDELPAGAPLVEHLQIADEVLDLAVAPNRPDCLGVYGVARELHAVTGAPLAEDPAMRDATPASDDEAGDHCSVEIAEPDVCLRFTARVFEDVRIGPSPLWLKARLSAAGQRPISNVVDITNYVMLLTGQPLHAFDLDEVRGRRIVVRRAREGERMTTLDGVDRELNPSIAVVCDAEGPSGIAGIMGGQISEVSDTTTRVLMEAATWVGPNILHSEAKLGLRTEASNRFEKQLHPELAMAGQRLAARLMVELCGARMVRGTLDVYPHPAEPRAVPLRLDRIEQLLGVAVPREEVTAILTRLGFRVMATGERMSVTVPYWRDGDVQREADLVEEVGRVYGLERIPRTLPARRRAVGGLTREQRLRRRVEDAMRHRGAAEVVSYSFTSPAKIERVRLGDRPVLRLANPLSEEQSVMRPLLLPGLLDAARHNVAHGRPELALFESAHVYGVAGPIDEAPEGSPRGATPARERHHLSALFTRGAAGGWRTPASEADFYSAKGVLEGALASLGLDLRTEPAERPFLHPGRAAAVLAEGGTELGWIGELHPLVAREWDVPAAAAFEIDLDSAIEIEPGERPYRDVTTYPAIVQDIAVVAPEDVPAARIEAAVREGGGELLDTLRVFDLFRGEQVGEGNRSLALRLEFRSPQRTLTDEDVAALREAIEERLSEIGGRLRA
jgi:phenylalanyl-tRNA synthetase beta chain